MQNAETKKEMVKNGKYSDLRKFDNYCYREYGLNLTDLINKDNDKERIATISNLTELIYKNTNITNITVKELTSYLQLKKSRHNKKTRIGTRLNYYRSRNYKLCFATFTFNNEALALDNNYRKELITRELNKNKNIVDYIGNIDFGTLNEREHYHYILILTKDFEPKTKIRTKTTNGKFEKYNSIENLEINYTKGIASFELVGNGEIDLERTKQYIAKLTLHALKESTKEKLIFKRSSPYLEYKHRIENHNKEVKDKQKEKEKKSIEKLKILDFETGAIYN